MVYNIKNKLLFLCVGMCLALSSAYANQQLTNKDTESELVAASCCAKSCKAKCSPCVKKKSSSCKPCERKRCCKPRKKCCKPKCGCEVEAKEIEVPFCEERRCTPSCSWGPVQSTTTDNNYVSVKTSLSSCVQLNKEFCMKLKVEARADSENVMVRTDIPEGAQYIESDPPATVEGNQLVWQFDHLCSKERRYLNVWFKALREGCLETCSTVHAIPETCNCTSVGKPILGICKDGPELVVEGDTVYYDIYVSNSGTYPAYDVSVTDYLPTGIVHSSCESVLCYDFGTIDPCETKKVRVKAIACEPGQYCNKASVNTSNAGEAHAEACTRVLAQGIAIKKEGTETLFVGKVAEYTITITNTGENVLHDVEVWDVAPRGTEIVGAQGSDHWDCTRAYWMVCELAPGETQVFKVALQNWCTGFTCNKAVVSSCEGARDEAYFETEWLGHPAILVEVRDDCDPLIVGEETCYHIRISNQGTAADENLQITARFSNEIQPVEAFGHATGDVTGQVVVFEPIDSLEAGEYVEFQITGRAMNPGDGRLRVDLKSKLLQQPVSEEESTHIY